jgi:hypothetical protein
MPRAADAGIVERRISAIPMVAKTNNACPPGHPFA